MVKLLILQEKIDTSRNWSRKMKYLDDGVDILITNLNKINRLINNKKIVLSNTNFFVIDESDVFVENSKKDFDYFIKLTQQKYYE